MLYAGGRRKHPAGLPTSVRTGNCGRPRPTRWSSAFLEQCLRQFGPAEPSGTRSDACEVLVPTAGCEARELSRDCRGQETRHGVLFCCRGALVHTMLRAINVGTAFPFRDYTSYLFTDQTKHLKCSLLPNPIHFLFPLRSSPSLALTVVLCPAPPCRAAQAVLSALAARRRRPALAVPIWCPPARQCPVDPITEF